MLQLLALSFSVQWGWDIGAVLRRTVHSIGDKGFVGSGVLELSCRRKRTTNASTHSNCSWKESAARGVLFGFRVNFDGYHALEYQAFFFSSRSFFDTFNIMRSPSQACRVTA
jgi:hypothetical protein